MVLKEEGDWNKVKFCVTLAYVWHLKTKNIGHVFKQSIMWSKIDLIIQSCFCRIFKTWKSLDYVDKESHMHGGGEVMKNTGECWTK
jgi:hypothetical protein